MIFPRPLMKPTGSLGVFALKRSQGSLSDISRRWALYADIREIYKFAKRPQFVLHCTTFSGVYVCDAYRTYLSFDIRSVIFRYVLVIGRLALVKFLSRCIRPFG